MLKKQICVNLSVVGTALGFAEGVEDEADLLRGEDTVLGYPAGAAQGLS